MESLEKTLYRASSLARCHEFIRWMRQNREGNILSVQDVNWVLNLFIINPFYNINTGEVLFLLYKMDSNLAEDLISLSDKIKNHIQLNEVDWDLILCGIEQYRRKLLNKSFQQDCGEIW
jgi:hypothetical protein